MVILCQEDMWHLDVHVVVLQGGVVHQHVGTERVETEAGRGRVGVVQGPSEELAAGAPWRDILKLEYIRLG